MVIPIFIADPSRWYDDLQMREIDIARADGDGWRSLTAIGAAKASAVGSRGENFDVEGKTFELDVDGSLFDLTFAAVNPVSAATVAAEINAGVTGVLAVDAGGYVQVDHLIAGAGHRLDFRQGTANSALGFADDLQVEGKSAYPLLVDGATHYYFFDDPVGEVGRVYRWRLSSSITGGHSDWQEEMTAVAGWQVDLAQVCLGWVDLVDVNGSPMDDVDVHVGYPKTGDGVVLGGRVVMANSTTFTVVNGRGWIFLPRQAVVDLVVETTGFVRRLTIPDQQTVDLFDPMLGVGDLFEVQTVDIPWATRTVL